MNKLVVGCVDGEDFESRFTFSDDLPPPDRWEAGPKTYPSKARSAKGKILFLNSLNMILANKELLKRSWTQSALCR